MAQINNINNAEELIVKLYDICIGRNLRNQKAIFIDLPRALKKNEIFEFISANK